MAQHRKHTAKPGRPDTGNPPGLTAGSRFADFICIGIARSTYLFGDQYQADQIYRWEFNLEPTSYVFAEGDRVRLEIAASAFPLYDRNPSSNIKPSEMSQWNWQRSTHMIYHDADHRSALHLPVVS